MKNYRKILTKKRLYNEYIVSNKSLKDLTLLFLCAESTISNYLKQYNIKKNLKLNLDKKVLIDLYWNQMKNSRQIAEYFNCSQPTVLTYIDKYNIKKRTLSESSKLSGHNKGELNISKRKDVRIKIRLSKLNKKRIDMLGNKNPAKQITVREKISKALKNRQMNWGYKISLTMIARGTTKGKNNGHYIHGQAHLPYSSKFTPKLKLEIRTRDKFVCQGCDKKEQDNYRVLDVHHIDYNKMNCSKNNLITLCNSCNMKANTNIDYWYAYYMYIIKNIIYREK